jgi:AAA+ superfamily predicted ATPase
LWLRLDVLIIFTVLLRVLEYYEGIMILTTNRITSLDIAVQSRIHLAIRYEDLTNKQKIEIFRHFLSQLEPDSIEDFEDIMEYIKEHGAEADLNGRQIRNIVSSSLSLARNDKSLMWDGRLTKKHLKEVMRITNDFQKQLEKITMEHRSTNETRRSKN